MGERYYTYTHTCIPLDGLFHVLFFLPVLFYAILHSLHSPRPLHLFHGPTKYGLEKLPVRLKFFHVFSHCFDIVGCWKCTKKQFTNTG